MRAVHVLRAVVMTAVGAFCAVPSGAHAFSTFNIDIERFSFDDLFPGETFTVPDDELPTFSGFGTITFDPVATDPSDIVSLSLTIETLGTDASNEFGFGADTVHVFEYDETDIQNVTNLGFNGSSLTGSLDFVGLPGKDSTTGEVVLQSLVLDFDAALASGFCFSGGGEPGTAECIRGGGTSTGIEASLKTSVIPLPAPFALLLVPVIGLAALGRMRQGGPAQAA